MPPEPSGEARDRDSILAEEAVAWLRRARSNLVRAKMERPEEVLWEDLCFDAQQAAEKAIKGVLVRLDVDFPKTHDIRKLLDLVESSGRSPPDEVRAAESLTGYAVESRYPEGEKPVTEDEHREAVALAERVVRWAETIIGGGK